MVNVRVDGVPIAFSGQIVAYGTGVVNTINERIFVDTNQRVITTPNPNPTTDNFYTNLATGAFGNRGKVNRTDGKVEVSSTDGVYSPNV